jgi:ribonuclease P protein component
MEAAGSSAAGDARTGRGFSPAERLRNRAQYEAVYEQGSKRSGRLMTLFVLENAAGHARLGIAATRKLGSAVVRNRAKRLVREVFRLNKPPAGVDIVVIPRRELVDSGPDSIAAELAALMKRRGRRPREA